MVIASRFLYSEEQWVVSRVFQYYYRRYRMLTDNYNRVLKTLRIVVNNECNLSCIYCHREGVDSSGKGNILTPKEIAFIARVASRLGIENFKLTGGEPLLRRDIVDIVKELTDIKPKDLSMTTNGSLLTLYSQSLSEAGLRRINVGLPSLNRDRYKHITGMDLLEQVIKGIKMAYNVGLNPITINVVVLKGVTENEYKDFIDFVSKIEGRLRFIELESIGMARRNFKSLYDPMDNILRYLEEIHVKKYVRYENHRPVYVLSNGIEVEIVKWYKNKSFCMYCDRIRLVYDGSIKPCIATDTSIDITKCLKPTVDEKCIEETIMSVNSIRKPFWLSNT